MRKYLVIIAGVFGIAFGIGFLTWWIPKAPSDIPVQTIVLEDEDARQQFLADHGVAEGRCIAVQTIRLPADTNGIFQAYADLQQSQGFPLTSRIGASATRYTYAQSSSGQDHLYTELLLDETQIVIGAIQYNTLSGTMYPLLQEVN